MKKFIWLVMLLVSVFSFGNLVFAAEVQTLRMVTDNKTGELLEFGPVVATPVTTIEQIIRFEQPPDFPAKINWLAIGQRLSKGEKVFVPEKSKPTLVTLFPAIEFQGGGASNMRSSWSIRTSCRLKWLILLMKVL